MSLLDPTFQPQITVYELANRLNLDVRQINTKHALLTKGANTTATVRAMTRAGLASRGVRRADYRVLTRTQCPAVLVELGYLSNPAEARLLASNSGQERLAESLAEGLLAFVRASGGG